MRSRRWMWAALFSGVMLLAGMSIGVMADRLWLLGPPRPFRGQVDSGVGGPLARGALRSATVLGTRLGLTAEQRAKVDAVLKEWEGRTSTLQDDLRDRFVQSQDELRKDIEAVLTPEQVQRFRNLAWIDRRPGLGGELRGRGPGGRRGGPPPGRGRE